MKKIYTLALATFISIAAISQTPFWTSTSYKGAFPLTDGLTGTTSNDWTAGWTNFDPQIAVYPAPTQTITGSITSQTWSPSNTYLLSGTVAVASGNTLTILPGTVIKGDKNSKACLIITKGAQINAAGTVNNPIVFTSNESVRNPADWGGIVILGNGVVNTPCATCPTNPNQNFIEGFATQFPEISYGGNNNTESSGVITYCRIEFAGVALSTTPNSELNGLTMGGVGSGTQIHHIQVSFGGDDSFEWFGGAVDAKYLISFRGLDDDFDTDYGYAGRVQFGLIVRDKDISDAAGDSNGFESDNSGGTGLNRLPVTKAIFSNITSIGPKRDGSVTLPSGEKFERGIFTRRNTALSIHNSILVGWEKGWHVSGQPTFDNYNLNTNMDSLGLVQNTIVASNVFPKFVHDAGGANATWYNAYAGINSIDTTKSVAQIAFVNAFPTELYDPTDFRLTAASTASTGASFSGPQFAGQVTGVKSITNKNLNSFVIYPNPAKQNTTISFNIIEKNKVTVNVYDVLGNVVTTLSQSNDFEKGNNTININTSNLSSGIYYISLDVNGAKETKKLIINN
jgi:hypothetical protein